MRLRQGQGGAVIALVLILLAGLIGGLLMLGPGYLARNKGDERSTTQTRFNAIHEALATFVMLNARLPCPAKGTQSTGLEDATGSTCSSPSGPVPWTTLSLPQSAVLDAYGRLISYRVFDGASGFTRANGLSLANCLEQDDTTVVALPSSVCNATTHENTRSDFLDSKGLVVDDRGTSKTHIAYVLISHGASGYGAWLPDPAVTMATPTAGSKEQVNASSSLTYWILGETASSIAAEDTNHFDDIVSYRSAKDLVVAAKQSGRPWQLSASFGVTQLGNPSAFNLGSGATTSTEAGTGIKVTTDDAARYLCRLKNSIPEGIAPCTTSDLSGNDSLTSSGNEKLVFTFRVKRRYLWVEFTEFRTSAGDSATVTFYDGSTLVQSVTRSACHNTNNVGSRFAVTPSARFTKVEIAATSGSDFAVSSIAACNSTTAASCFLRNAGPATICATF